MFSFGVNNFQSAYGRWSNVRGGFSSLPPAGRFLVMAAAVPGILLAVLSVLLFMVSILALLLLTVPVYRIVRAVTGGGSWASESQSVNFPFDPGPGRKQVDVRVVEQ
jgi:hypothetical protein